MARCLLLVAVYVMATDSALYGGIDGIQSLFGTQPPPTTTQPPTQTAVKTFPPPGPGQVQSAPCALTVEGCCKDHQTRAPGPKGKGCARLLCYDEHPETCRFWKFTGELNCNARQRGHSYVEICPFTCRKCRPAASPLSRCLGYGPLHGCCWDGTPALGPNNRGCRPCRDNYPHPCKQFSHVSGGCNSGSFGIRSFMDTHCPRTCGRCAGKK